MWGGGRVLKRKVIRAHKILGGPRDVNPEWDRRERSSSRFGPSGCEDRSVNETGLLKTG